MNGIMALLDRIYSPSKTGDRRLLGKKSKKYWTGHNVTIHHDFQSAEESLEYFQWRNDQYFNYIELMPVSGQDGKVVLDYGCGPGHDIVGFGVYSRAAQLIGMDISTSSLDETGHRIALHGIKAELVRLDPDAERLPMDDETVDYIHCSGVLHHTADPLGILQEFRRILAPDGSARVMVYNKNSLHLHLLVAYELQLRKKKHVGLPLLEAFGKSTDGVDCPISRAYAPDEFVELARQAGFAAEYLGAAISMDEADLFHKSRYRAIRNRALPAECRRFLLELEIDPRGFPMYRGTYAGVDACFKLTKGR